MGGKIKREKLQFLVLSKAVLSRIIPLLERVHSDIGPVLEASFDDFISLIKPGF